MVSFPHPPLKAELMVQVVRHQKMKEKDLGSSQVHFCAFIKIRHTPGTEPTTPSLRSTCPPRKQEPTRLNPFKSLDWGLPLYDEEKTWIQNVFELVESQGGSGGNARPLRTMGAAESSPPRPGAGCCPHPTMCFCSCLPRTGTQACEPHGLGSGRRQPSAWASLPLGGAGAAGARPVWRQQRLFLLR